MKNLFQRKGVILCLLCLIGMLHGADAHAAEGSAAILHVHTGTSDEGGGCHGEEKKGSKQVFCGNYSTSYHWSDYEQVGYYNGTCQNCGHSYTGAHTPTTTHYKTKSYTYYVTNCGHEDNEIQGSLALTPSTTEWTKELTLTASYEVSDIVTVNENAYIWNSQDAVAENTYTVCENDVYTCQLNIDSEDAVSETASLEIHNIDCTAPAIYEVVVNEDSAILTDVMTAVVTAEDLQPDGTNGCGLHEQAYSWDEGETWIAENTYTITHNGTHTVWVRDALGNYAEAEMTVNNLDTYGPTVTYSRTPDIWTNGSVAVTVKAVDLQSDGTNGCGLHAKPYSWDEGKTWGTERSYETSSNTSRTVWVRDNFNNITKCRTVVDNIDKEPPVITLEAKNMSKQDVEQVLLTVSAYDAVSGLSYRPYSWDYGGNWIQEATCTVNHDGTYTVYARDNAGNMSWKNITVDEKKEGDEVLPVTPDSEMPPNPGNEDEEMPKTESAPIEAGGKEETEAEEEAQEPAPEQQKTAKKKTQSQTVQDKKENKGHSLLEKIAAVLSGTGTGCFLFLFFLYVFSAVEIQGLDAEGKYTVLGRWFIGKKKRAYFISIPQIILNKSEVNRYRLVFGKYFAKQNEGKELLIKTNQKQQHVLIKKEIDFTV